MCNLVLEGGLIQEIFGKINTFFLFSVVGGGKRYLFTQFMSRGEKPQNHGKSCRYHEDIK